MPPVAVLVYQEDDASAPLRDWLAGLPAESRDRCLARIDLLAERGHELRRPHAEYLAGTDLYELRVKVRNVQLRLLYFFDGRSAVVLSHGFAKEGKIPPAEIRLAMRHMENFRADPDRHTFKA